MVKNLKGGKKHKKFKNLNTIKTIEYKMNANEEYGQIIKLLGSCRFIIDCKDGKERLGQLRKGLRKKVKITIDDWVLVNLRGFETFDKKCDIIFKYSPEDVIKLKKEGLIETNQKNTFIQKEDICFDFDDI